MKLGAAALIAGLLVVAPVAAHPSSFSGLRVLARSGGASLRLDVDGRTVAAVLAEKIDRNHDQSIDAGEMRDARDVVVAYVETKIAVRNGRAPCDFVDAPLYRLREDAGRLDVGLEVRCSGPWADLSVENRAFFEDVGGHRWVTAVRVGAVRHEALLTPEEPSTTVAISEGASLEATDGDAWLDGSSTAARSAESKPVGEATRVEPASHSVFLAFLEQGVRHILSGVDHVLFVVALVLAVARFRNLVLVITAFTLAHSVTLALGALEIVAVPARLIEPAIALTIAYVAAENVMRDEPRHRPALAFAFGIVHGFGFSTVLRDVGLPRGDLVRALCAFNLGVEIGQLALVAPLFALVVLLRRREETYQRVRLGASLAIAAVAVVWVVERVFDVKIVPMMGS